MPHETSLILTISAGIALAFAFGVAASRLRLPPLVGYLLAGILIGPFTPGYIADAHLAQQLAEIGVILLMFGVGIHFSARDLLAVWRIAVPGAIVQIAVATAFGLAATRLWGWPRGSGIVFGLCLSVASTIVLLRALEGRGGVDSTNGRIAVGWLIVEDLVTVLVLVLLPVLAEPLGGSAEALGDHGASSNIYVTIGITLAKVAAFVALMLVVGRRAVPWLLLRVARSGSRELFTLAVLAVALGTAVGASALFGISFALGAFFAGMVVNASDLSHEAAREALPLQDAFSVLFFVAVGMLFDPTILVHQPFAVLCVVLIIIVAKSLAACVIVLALGYPLGTALTISASLAQIGEFSFILAALGIKLKLLTTEAQSMIVAGAILSITLNQATFALTTHLTRWVGARPRLLSLLERSAGAIAEPPREVGGASFHDHVVLVGHGRVGSSIRRMLAARSIPHVVIEENRDVVTRLREAGIAIFHGDATRAEVLAKAGIERARLLVVATPEAYQTRAIMEAARKANPAIDTVVRSHSEAERTYLEEHGAKLALVGEHELAYALGGFALRRMGCSEEITDETLEVLRAADRKRA
ncbi:MAG: Kef family K(+) transporter [Labilithrix sp.]|nr:Kef family K(+) transporter [Labilithrix sp.]